jgi:phosphoribosylformimino-5-aminoimidazole carboxamide ribotide isomerase
MLGMGACWVLRRCVLLYSPRTVRVIGVVDLVNGRAVHARAGRRARYEPVRLVASHAIEPGDAVALARAYRELAVPEIYVADLDAIAGGGWQKRLLGQIMALGLPVWLDAGCRSLDAARLAIELGARQLVVGLETLPSFETLTAIGSCFGKDRVAFSLDLRRREPVAPNACVPPGTPAATVAARAAGAVGTIIVLDLAQVGMKGGPDLDVIAQVRAAAPAVALLAGGGVRGLEDLRRLAAVGCEGALVATTIHEGRLSAVDLVTARGWQSGPRELANRVPA